jgi:hypothetical protein
VCSRKTSKTSTDDDDLGHLNERIDYILCGVQRLYMEGEINPCDISAGALAELGTEGTGESNSIVIQNIVS